MVHFPGNRVETRPPWRRAALSRYRNSAREHGRSLFNENYRTIVNVIRVTVPERMRMESSTYRGSGWPHSSSERHSRTRLQSCDDHSIPWTCTVLVCVCVCLCVGATGWRRLGGLSKEMERGRKRERERKGGKKWREKGQAMTIARGAPVALFRLIFSVDISVSFYARKCERPLGVGMSVVTAGITGRSINEGKKKERERKEGREERERENQGKRRWSVNRTTLSRVCDRCFTTEFNGCPVWRVMHSWMEGLSCMDGCLRAGLATCGNCVCWFMPGQIQGWGILRRSDYCVFVVWETGGKEKYGEIDGWSCIRDI